MELVGRPGIVLVRSASLRRSPHSSHWCGGPFIFDLQDGYARTEAHHAQILREDVREGPFLGEGGMWRGVQSRGMRLGRHVSGGGGVVSGGSSTCGFLCSRDSPFVFPVASELPPSGNRQCHRPRNRTPETHATESQGTFQIS